MNKLTSLAVFLVAVFGFSTSASAVTLFLLEQGSGGTQKLYKLETDSLGAPTLIGSISSSEYDDVVELVTVSSDRLYAFERSGSDLSRPARLLTINTSDASVISAVPIPSFNRGFKGRGFDLSPDGVLYGVFPDGSGNLELRIIAPATGATTFVSRLTSGNFVEALAFAPDGTLYAAAFPPGNLFTIDIPTGVMTQIGASIGEVDTLAYASDGFLYGARSGPGRRSLFRIDPATAALTVVGDTLVDSIVGMDEEIAIQQAEIDIQPGADLDCINNTPVAIHGSADFDVSNINQESLMYGDSGGELRGGPGLRCSMYDTDSDGFMDLVCTFVPGTGEATIHGEFFDGTGFEGSDTICVTR
jgi:hypothetical protein